MMRKFTLPLVAALALPASAQATPPEVLAILEEATALCGAGADVAPEALANVDLNGDRKADWLVDTGAIFCPGEATLYCGSAGCGVTTLIDGVRGNLTLHDWGVETSGGTTYLTAPNDQGETVRFLWTGSEWQFQ